MFPIKLFVETGKKRVFAGALDWPGWCRCGRDEVTALQALLDYGPRYAHLLLQTAVAFRAPHDASELMVVERHDGNATTDFGAPAIMLDADREPASRLEWERWQVLLPACWQAFDNAVQQAAGKPLRKGPRGGGRDLEKIIQHVLEADREYLRRLAWKQKWGSEHNPGAELRQTRQAILSALEGAARGTLPERGPRGAVIWSPRYFVRRVAWHVVDHAWEIEDRVIRESRPQ